MLKLKKLLVLGGCGLIGAEVVRDLAATSEFEKITVADGNIEKAEELVASLNDPRFDARAVQVKDKASVVALMKDGYDLVCNCLPFEFDTYITQCCVDAGVTGTDLGATKDQLAMNGLLEEKGLLFVVCDGISPGTSNMIASYANEKLDRLDEVHIAFASFRAIQTAPGAGAHHAVGARSKRGWPQLLRGRKAALCRPVLRRKNRRFSGAVRPAAGLLRAAQ